MGLPELKRVLSKMNLINVDGGKHVLAIFLT